MEVQGNVEIEVRDGNPDRAREARARALAAGEKVAARLFADREGSEIDVLNAVPSHIWIELSEPTLRDLRRAQAIAEDSEGAYDPTDPPLAQLWGFSEKSAHSEEPLQIPRDFEIEMRLRRVDWENIEVDEEKPMVRRAERRSELDLGGFAAGLVVDAILETLENAGVPAARVRAGQITGVYGATATEPFVVTLRLAGEALKIPLLDGALAAVAPEHLRKDTNGALVHELIDPRSGRPATELGAVALIAPDAASAAAYGRAVFMMGSDARRFVESRPQLRALLIDRNGKRSESSGFPEFP